MKKIKFLALAVALAVSATASAQFSNTGKKSSGSHTSDGDSGYRAFVEAGYTVGTGEAAADRIAVSTSHGYQINPYVFVGGGAGVNYYHSAEQWSIPIFANARGTLQLDGSVSPFLDIKIGYSAADVSGFYFSPSVGCKFGKFTVSAGYELQKMGSEEVSSSYSIPGYGYYTASYETGGGTVGGFAFKIGMEF